MRPPLDLANKKFGRLTVIDVAYKKNKAFYWNCICDCGNKSVVMASALKSNKIISCGCYNKERIAEACRKYRGGEKIDKVTIVSYDKNKKKYKCRCECGNIVYKDVETLKRDGAKHGCGCFGRANLNDLIGKKIGRLTVLSSVFSINKKWFYRCKCDCGKEKLISRNSLKQGDTLSCGCYKKECRKGINKIHGMTGTRVHRIWVSMKSRCYNPNNKKYPRYGARGITVCEEWKNTFLSFYDWAMNNGYSDNLSIDRIDVNGNYEPSNCRWVTNKVQANNKTTNKFVVYKGETKTVAEWADILNFDYYLVVRRIRLGWDVEKAFTTPSRSKPKKLCQNQQNYPHTEVLNDY